MKERRIELPTKKSGAWQNETYKYVGVIDNSTWPKSHKRWAQKQQNNGLPSHMAFIKEITPITFNVTDKPSKAKESNSAIPTHHRSIPPRAPERG